MDQGHHTITYSICFSFSWWDENILHLQHGCNAEYLFWTAKLIYGVLQLEPDDNNNINLILEAF